MFAVALGDAFLAEVILEHGGHWAPAPPEPGYAPSWQGATRPPGIPAKPVKD